MMRQDYDFEQMKGRRNSYAKNLKKQVTIRTGADNHSTVDKYASWLQNLRALNFLRNRLNPIFYEGINI